MKLWKMERSNKGSGHILDTQVLGISAIDTNGTASAGAMTEAFRVG